MLFEPAVVGRDGRTTHVPISVQHAKRLAEAGERQRLPTLECGECRLYPVEIGQPGGRARPPRRPNGDRALGRGIQGGDPVDEFAVQLGQHQRSVGPPDPFVGQPATPAAALEGPIRFLAGLLPGRSFPLFGLRSLLRSGWRWQCAGVGVPVGRTPAGLADGVTITLRRSKTDQDGAGRKIGIPYGSNPETSPVRTVQAWLEQAGISTGPLFRSINRHGQVQPGRLSGIDVARVTKKLAARAGLDPAKYAGHSLRAGHATAAAIAGASEPSIMKQTGHRSVQMVRRYIREGNLFRENSAGKLGL